MSTAGALALGAAAAASTGLLCALAGLWLTTPTLALALFILCWAALLSTAAANNIRRDKTLSVWLVGWFIVGSIVCAILAAPLLPWGSNWSPATSTLAWFVGVYAGVPVAAIAASVFPDRRQPAAQTHG